MSDTKLAKAANNMFKKAKSTEKKTSLRTSTLSQGFFVTELMQSTLSKLQQQQQQPNKQQQLELQENHARHSTFVAGSIKHNLENIKSEQIILKIMKNGGKINFKGILPLKTFQKRHS